MSKSVVVKAGTVCVVTVLPGFLAAGTAAADAAGFLTDGELGGGGGGFACVASPLPAATTPVAAPSSAAPTPISPAPAPPTTHPSSPTALPAIPVSRVEPLSVAPTAAPPSAALVSPSPTFRKTRGLSPLTARHVRRHLPLLMVLVLVAVIPAVLALVRRGGAGSAR